MIGEEKTSLSLHNGSSVEVTEDLRRVPNLPAGSALIVKTDFTPILGLNASKSNDLAMFSSSKSGFEEVNTVMETIDKLEGNYAQRLHEAAWSNSPFHVILLKDEIEEVYESLIGEINRYRNSRSLKRTLAGDIFERYAKDIQQKHDDVMNILAVYTDWQWPRSRMKSKQYDLNHKQAAGVWQTWSGNAQKQELVELKKQHDQLREGDPRQVEINEEIAKSLRESMRAEILSLAGYLNSRFKVILYEETLLPKGKSSGLTAKDIESFAINFRFTPDDLEQMEKEKNPFIQAVALEGTWQAIARGLVTKAQLEEIQNILGKALGKDFKRVRTNAALKRNFILMTALAVLAGIGGDGSRISKDLTEEKAPALNQHNNVSGQQQPASPKPAPVLSQLQLADILSFTNHAPLPELQTDQKSEELKKAEDLIVQLDSQLTQVDQRIANNTQALETVQTNVSANFKKIEDIASTKSAVRPPQPPPMPEVWHQSKSPQTNTTSNPFQANGSASSFENTKFNGPTLGKQKVTQGVTSQESESGQALLVAQVHGNFNYLAEGIYTHFNPITGEFFPQPPDIHPWPLTSQATDEYVTIPSHGKKDFLAPMPPGYKIVRIETQNEVGSSGAFYDQVNHAWYVSFSADPGFVRLGVKPADVGEIKPTGDLTMVDENNRPLSPQTIDQQFKGDLPPALWDFIQEHRNDPTERRQELPDQLMDLKWFYYTTNYKLGTNFNSGHSIQRSIFENNALKCDGFTTEYMLLSGLLGVKDIAAEWDILSRENMSQARCTCLEYKAK